MNPLSRNVAIQDRVEGIRYESFWSNFREGRSGDSNFCEHYSHFRANHHLIDAVLTWIREPRQKFLDIGCGQGRNALALAELGHSIVGIDISPSAIEIARARATASHLTELVDFEVASVFDYGKSGRRFRGIYDDGCLQHIVPSLWDEYIRSIKILADRTSHFFLLGFSEHTNVWKAYRRESSQENEILEADGHYTRLFNQSDIKYLAKSLGQLKSQLKFRQNRDVIWGLWVFELSPGRE